MTLSELWFSQGICPVVGLLGRMVVLFSVDHSLYWYFAVRPTVIETDVYVNSIGPVDPINMVSNEY